MKYYEISYIGIGGIERKATIEASNPYDARAKFKKSYWSYHEILKIEEVS